MTSEPWKTIKFWLEICAAAYVVVGAVLQYSVMAVPFIPTILKYGWPLIAAYGAFRIFQFGKNFYQRFTRLELDVFGNAVDVDTRLDEQAKAHRDSVDEMKKSLHQEMQKRQYLEKVLRLEIKEREKLGAQVAELEKRLSASQKREPTLTPAECLVPSGGMMQLAADKKPQAKRSLADMGPGGLLALGATPPKRTT